MLAQSIAIRRLVMVRLNPDDDLLQSLTRAAQENGIRNGLILNGVGSLNRYRVHVVDLPSLPTRNLFLQGDGPFDILTFSGMIVDGRVHAHITFADAHKAMGGHLEEGCRALTFAIVMLADTPDADLTGWDTSGVLG